MKDQVIKVGDYVYIPSYSNKPLLVGNANSPIWDYCVEINKIVIYLHSNGLSSPNHIQPIAWLATLENKAKIEAFYDIELEDTPVVKELDNFCKELELLLKAQKELSSLPIHADLTFPDSRQTKRNTLANQIKNHQEHLIQMFKDKGKTK